MMATVPHFTSGLGFRKFQADGFLLTRVYIHVKIILTAVLCKIILQTIPFNCLIYAYH